MNEKILPLLKARLGISTESRDILLSAIVNGIVSDCASTHGVVLSDTKPEHIMFVLDWATWKYGNPGGGPTPQSIKYRLMNLIMQKAGRADGNVGQ